MNSRYYMGMAAAWRILEEMDAGKDPQGDRQSLNPFKDGVRRQNWDAGWVQAQEDIAREQEREDVVSREGEYEGTRISRQGEYGCDDLFCLSQDGDRVSLFLGELEALLNQVGYRVVPLSPTESHRANSLTAWGLEGESNY